MDETVDEFEELLDNAIKKRVPIQTQWVTIENVRKDEMLCDAKDIHSDLDFYDIWLGLGSMVNTPNNNTTALIGLIENNPAKSFLIMCEELENLSIKIENNHFEMTKDMMKLYSDSFGGLVKSKVVAKEINALKKELNDLKQVFTTWVIAPSDGGATLKSSITSWSSAKLKDVKKEKFENEKVKHGE